jgi:hypothetical protein
MFPEASLEFVLGKDLLPQLPHLIPLDLPCPTAALFLPLNFFSSSGLSGLSGLSTTLTSFDNKLIVIGRGEREGERERERKGKYYIISQSV